MKHIEFGPSGWRSFLGRSLVGTAVTALCALGNVHAQTTLVLDTFLDSLNLQVGSANTETCETTMDSSNGQTDMGGGAQMSRTTCVTITSVSSDGAAGASAKSGTGVLTVNGDHGNVLSYRITYQNNNGNSSINLLGSGGSTAVVRLQITIIQDRSGGGHTLSFTDVNGNTVEYSLSVSDVSSPTVVEITLGVGGTQTSGTGPVDFANLSSYSIRGSGFQDSTDLTFRALLRTPVEIADFDCNYSNGMVNFEWTTTLEEEIGKFMVGTCSSSNPVNCNLHADIMPQGVGFPYKASLAAAGCGVCAMAAMGTNGQLEKDSNGQVVIHTGGGCD